jgi:hypothetical protein
MMQFKGKLEVLGLVGVCGWGKFLVMRMEGGF